MLLFLHQQNLHYGLDPTHAPVLHHSRYRYSVIARPMKRQHNTLWLTQARHRVGRKKCTFVAFPANSSIMTFKSPPPKASIISVSCLGPVSLEASIVSISCHKASTSAAWVRLCPCPTVSIMSISCLHPQSEHHDYREHHELQKLVPRHQEHQLPVSFESQAPKECIMSISCLHPSRAGPPNRAACIL